MRKLVLFLSPDLVFISLSPFAQAKNVYNVLSTFLGLESEISWGNTLFESGRTSQDSSFEF